MKSILIIGAGAMGAAFTVPCIDINHNVTLSNLETNGGKIESVELSYNEQKAKTYSAMLGGASVINAVIATHNKGSGATVEDFAHVAHIDEIKQEGNLLSIALYVKHKVKDKGPTPKIAVKNWQQSKNILSDSLKTITKDLEEK